MASAGTNLSIAVKLLNEAKSDMAKLDKDIEKVGTTAKTSGGHLGGMGSALGGVAKIASGFVVAQGLLKLPGLIGGLTSSASDLNESLSKAQVVFGTSAKDIETFASSAAKNLGISKQAALEAAGSLGNLFQTMGVGQAPAAAMSKSMLTLAADLASFNNLDPAVVLDKLRSGLVGEAEPLRALGVGLTAVSVEAKAMELGFRKVNGELSEGAKVQARYALILEQTKTAQGDFGRTAEGAANQQRILKAQAADLSAELGTRLLPVQVALQKFMIDYLVPALITAADWIGPKISAAIDIAEPKLRAVGEFIRDTVVPALKDFWEKLQPVVDALKTGFEFEWKALKAAGEFIRDVALPALKDLAELGLGKVKEKLDAINWTPMVEALGKTRDYVRDINEEDIAGWWATFKEKMQPVIDALGPFVERVLVAWLGQFKAIKEESERLWKALEPFEPLLTPLAKLIGVTLVGAVAAALLMMEGFIRFNTLVFVVAIEALIVTLEALWKAWEIGSTIWDKVIAGFSEGVEQFKAAWNDPIAFLVATGEIMRTWALNVGKAIIQGVIDGLMAMIGKLKDTLDFVTNFIKAHKGPIEEDRKLLFEEGEAIIEGLIDGMLSEAGAPMKNALNAIAEKIKADMSRIGGLFGAINPNEHGLDPWGGGGSGQPPNPTTNPWPGAGYGWNPDTGAWDRVPGGPQPLTVQGTIPGLAGGGGGGSAQQPIVVSVQIDGREIAYALANQTARAFA